MATVGLVATRRAFLEALGAAGLWSYAERLVAMQAGDRIARYPALETLLRSVADDRSRGLGASGLEIRPVHCALADSLDQIAVTTPGRAAVDLLPDALLVAAVDVGRSVWVEGDLTLRPAADLRPGLRATVLCDTTVIGAPMVASAPWGIAEITDAAPLIHGRVPPSRVTLGPWLMRPGRRYLTVAGPHFRAGGQFVELRLRVLDRPVEVPRATFAFISDTHVRRDGREDWMNRKLGDASAPEFLRTLQALDAEGVDYVVHGGDMTERATRDEFVLMRDTLRAQRLPVYGCIGNHDRYLDTSRADAREVLAEYFPGGALDYTLAKPPLRFVVLDVLLERPEAREHSLAWLDDAMRTDTATPTIFVWHYPPFNRGGPSNCGFRLQDWSELGRDTVLDRLRRAPNLIACVNGHDHWDEVNVVGGIPFVQNAAFVEWPNTYRVYRVYDDHVEWEVRQVANRGYVRDSFLPAKAQSWMIATRDADLAGTIPLARRS